jgi:hypothetical protein
MLWNIPFPGWRTMFGGTAYGWHDRVRKEAAYYIASQNHDSSWKTARADTNLLSTLQAQGSRFFGQGYIQKDQFIYNFQTQFFDQLITEWRFSGDTALEHLLRPALELHLKWESDCFDADGDGLYESYINTWPTDCQWYNGGATVEETAYAYKAHRAAMEMAARAGDSSSANKHQQQAVKIQRAFFAKLWITNKGYPGAYREQGGYQRLHEDPWLYSIFLPIDCELVNGNHAISALSYTQTALQNDSMPAGGRMVWASNWVPGIPTVREKYNGDNYHLALAYFLSGFGNEGWDIMKGTFYQGAFNGKTPGDLGSPNGGTDFNDCASMFARVLVEGLFGYRPDYPNRKVIIAPQFPDGWDNASIKTPDFAFALSTSGNVMTATVKLWKSARVDLELPLHGKRIETVLINGHRATWQLKGGVGCVVVHLAIPETSSTVIEMKTIATTESNRIQQFDRKVGERFCATINHGKIIRLHDDQKVLRNVHLSARQCNGIVARKTGHYTLVADVMTEGGPEKIVWYLNITDPEGEKKQSQLSLESPPYDAKWTLINLSSVYNGDVRTIFEQKYTSPRPNTVSARLGTDGYSPWTFLFWKYAAPEITLDSLSELLRDEHRLITKQAVPFYWNTQNRNIAFTSLWDNWPRRVEVPVKQKGRAIWFMIAGSTNPMQNHISNARVVLKYADKTTDTLPVIPPFNFWSLAPYNIQSPSPGVITRGDYTNPTDAFAVPKPWPELVCLGKNCRAIVLNRRLKQNVKLTGIVLETLSQEVVIGLMGLTIMK